MTSQLRLPNSTRSAMQRVELHERHAGLQLDKLSAAGEQTEQKHLLHEVCKTRRNDSLLNALLTRRRETLRACHDTKSFAAVTTGQLTLHLARASALENAGICLHPIYGFAYLPGSGLKGMARAFAETVWLPTQSDPRVAWRQIEDVFGWTSTRERREQIKDPNHPAQIRGTDDTNPESPELKDHVGNVVFHDAWPAEWPKLFVDIVNNHHPDYYGAPAGDNDHPPGDWENPRPVYFLAVEPNTEFEFAVSSRRHNRLTATPTACASRADAATSVSSESNASTEASPVQRAAQWLAGALCHLGAGAKTNAGYGAFRLDESIDETLKSSVTSVWKTAREQKHRDEFTCTLELVTPAFLAGANQNKDDCDLRAATLRGVLRWWWRTMHTGHVEPATLRTMEAAIWGDTQVGGAVRICVDCVERGKVTPVPGKFLGKTKDGRRDALRPDRDFANAHALERPPRKRTPGFLYLSFGMNEMPTGKRHEWKQRYCLLPGAKYSVALQCRSAIVNMSTNITSISASMVCEQAAAALWLLTNYGGVGSKARNGYGSFQSDISLTLEKVNDAAARLRESLGFDSSNGDATVSSLANMTSVSIPTPWSDYWYALDRLGLTIQDFCQQEGQKRTWVKEALGLPRKIGKSDNDGHRAHGYQRESDKQTRQEVVWLGQKHPVHGNRDAKDMRHASPIHLHLSLNQQGTYAITVTTFPSSVLPNLNTSESELAGLRNHLSVKLQSRSQRQPSASPQAGKPPRSQGPTTSIKVPEISTEDLVAQLKKLSSDQVIQRIDRDADDNGTYCTQKVTSAPKIPRKYQTAAGGRLIGAPTDLPSGTFVLAEGLQEKAKFVKAIGRFPPPENRKSASQRRRR